MTIPLDLYPPVVWREHGAQVELPNPVQDYHRAQLRDALRRYEAAQGVGVPVW